MINHRILLIYRKKKKKKRKKKKKKMMALTVTADLPEILVLAAVRRRIGIGLRHLPRSL